MFQMHAHFSYSFMYVVWQLAKLNNNNKKPEKGKTYHVFASGSTVDI